MFIFGVHHMPMILLLLLMGIQRSVGNPAVADNFMQVRSTGELEKHGLPHSMEKNDDEAEENHWECNRGSDYILERVKFITEFLEVAEKGLEKEATVSSANKTDFFLRLDQFFDKDNKLLLLRKLVAKTCLEGIIEYDEPLKKMTVIEKYSDSLIRTTMDWYNGKVKSDELDLTLSIEAKYNLLCLLRFMEHVIYKDNINAFVFHLTEVFKGMTELVSLKNSLEQLSGNLTETKDYMKFFKIMHKFLTDQNMFVSSRGNGRMSMNFQVGLLPIVDNKSMIFEPSSWMLSIKQWMDLLENEIGFYEQFNQYFDKLSDHSYSYESTPKGSWADWYNSLDEKKKSKLNHLIIMQQKYNITCDDGRLVVRGFWIQISDIDYRMLYSSCGCRYTIKLKEIALLAVDTVFFDENVNNLWKGVNLFIAAPKWRVDSFFGRKKISVGAMENVVRVI